MNVITYFEQIKGFTFSEQSEDIIQLWDASWKKHGWCPVVLNETHAIKNLVHDKLDLDQENSVFYRHAKPLPKDAPHPWRKYHRSCYRRLLAYCEYVRQNGPVLYSDYDVINYGFLPHLIQKLDKSSYFCTERAVVYLTEQGANDIERVLLEYCDPQNMDQPRYMNDMVIMQSNLREFSPVHHNLETGEKASNEYYYMENWGNGPMQDEALLIHYDNGMYGKGASRKYSRVDIIRQHNRL